MLRITDKEKSKIYSQNARVRKKLTNLKETYNMNVDFRIRTPKSFTTRSELNTYKQELKAFLSPYNLKFVKGGINMRNPNYFYPIPYQEYIETKRIIRKQNAYANRLLKKAHQIPLTIKGKPQDISVAEYIVSQRKNIKLTSPLQQFFPLKLQKEAITNQKTWDKFRGAVRQFHLPSTYRSRNNQARTNFITALYNTFGSNAEPIIRILDKLNGNEFISLYESEQYINFDYIYDMSYAKSLLSDIASGLVRWLAESETYQKQKFKTQDFLENLNDLTKMSDLTSAEILAEYTPHNRTFQFEGRTFHGTFRSDDLIKIDTGNIDESIIRQTVEYRNYADVRAKYDKK